MNKKYNKQIGFAVLSLALILITSIVSFAAPQGVVSTPDERTMDELMENAMQLGAQNPDERSIEELLAPALEEQAKEAEMEEKARKEAELKLIEQEIKFDSTHANTDNAVTDYLAELEGLGLQPGWFEDPISGNWYYILSNGHPAADYILYYQGESYYFDNRGARVNDDIVEYKGEKYYFDSNGVMSKNRWIMYNEPYGDEGKFEIIRYYFGPNGRAYRAMNSQPFIIKEIDGCRYAFDSEGRTLHGYIDETGNILDQEEDHAYETAVYYFGTQTEPEMQTGWVHYTGSRDEDRYPKSEVYLYFSPETGKKFYAKQDDNGTEKAKGRICMIEGLPYRFDEYGIMRSGWIEDNKKGSKDPVNKKYFSYEYEGWMTEGWFTAVPPENSTLQKNIDNHTSDNEKWYYADSRGYVVRNQVKKIGKNYYCFDYDGVMQEDVIVVIGSDGKIKERPSGLDNSNPYPFIPMADVSKAMIFADKEGLGSETDLLGLQDGDRIMVFITQEDEYDVRTTDGQMVFGNRPKMITIKGNDVEYRASANGSISANSVQDVVRYSDGKIYQNGVLLKAEDNTKFGIIQTEASTSPRYFVVDQNGKQLSSTGTCRKLGNSCYIVVGGPDSEYMGSFNVELKMDNVGHWQYREDGKTWKYFTKNGPGAGGARLTYSDILNDTDGTMSTHYNGLFACDTGIYINFTKYLGPAPSEK